MYLKASKFVFQRQQQNERDLIWLIERLRLRRERLHFFYKNKKNTPYNIIILHAHNFVDLNERNKTSTTSNVM